MDSESSVGPWGTWDHKPVHIPSFKAGQEAMRMALLRFVKDDGMIDQHVVANLKILDA